MASLKIGGRSSGRIINQKAIFETIYANDGISRAQIAKELGISKPAVASNVEKLIQLGLVEERGEGKGAKSGGRKPIMLYFNAEHHYIAAIDLSLQEPVCAISDLKYSLIGMKRVKLGNCTGEAERKEAIRDTLRRIFHEKGIPEDRLGIIVISQPGVLEGETGIHYSVSQHHTWTKIGLKDYLAAEFQVKVVVNNDVNVAAVGEIHFGCDKRLEDLIYVSCGSGLGAGIIINRKLYKGYRNAAGEIGSFIMYDGRTLEDRVAIKGLLQKVRKKMAKSSSEAICDQITFSDIVDLAKNKHPIVLEAIYETGKEIGIALFNISAVLDIDTIILGGDYIHLGETLFEGIEDVLQRGSMFRPEVLPSSLQDKAGVYGCFVLGVEKVIKNVMKI